MRIVPWLSPRNEWHATLIIEWIRDGKVACEERYVMDSREFDKLKEAVFQADNSEL